MQLVTLLSDFGTQDHYVAVWKAHLLQGAPLQFVDISHDVEPHNIAEAAFLLKHSYAHFPAGTVHLIYVHNETPPTRFLAIFHEGHYFIGPDNGIFSLVFDTKPQFMYELTPKQKSMPHHGLYTRAVRHIHSEKPFHEIGLLTDKWLQRIALQPVITRNQIRGSVIHIDHYGNVLLNIQRPEFERAAQGRDFELYFKRHDPITALSEDYYDTAVGEVLCFFNTSGHLEIAVNMGNAATLLGFQIDDSIQVDFLDDAPSF